MTDDQKPMPPSTSLVDDFYVRPVTDMSLYTRAAHPSSRAAFLRPHCFFFLRLLEPLLDQGYRCLQLLPLLLCWSTDSTTCCSPITACTCNVSPDYWPTTFSDRTLPWVDRLLHFQLAFFYWLRALVFLAAVDPAHASLVMQGPICPCLLCI